MEWAALLVKKLGPDGLLALPELIRCLEDEGSDWIVFLATAQAISAMGTDAGEAVPALIRAFDGLRVEESGGIGKGAPDGPFRPEALLQAAARMLQTAMASIAANQPIDALIRSVPAGTAKRDDILDILFDVGVSFGGLRRDDFEGFWQVASKRLVPLLGHDEAHVRYGAAYCLEALWIRHEFASPAAVLALGRSLEDRDAGVRRQAARSLRWMGYRAKAAVPALTNRLADPDPYVRRKAMDVLGGIEGAAKKALPELVAIAADPDRSLDDRQSALRAIHDFRRDAREAALALVELLGDDDVRDVAANTLIGITEANEGVLAPLAEVIAERVMAEHREFGEAMDEDEESFDPLFSYIRRFRVVTALGTAVSPTAPVFTERLSKSLASGRPRPSRLTPFARVLDALGPAASGAVPSLVELWRRLLDEHLDDDDEVLAYGKVDPRRVALRALAEAGEESPHGGRIVPVAAKILEAGPDDETGLRKEALELLGRLLAERETSVPLLIAALSEHDYRMRREAARSLGRFGIDAGNEAVRALRKALRDVDPRVRREAALALGEIGGPAAGAVPLLMRALEDEHPRVRRGAARALGLIGPDADEAVKALLRATHDHDLLVRRNAFEALGKLGPAGRSAAPRLREARDEEEVRHHAEKALERLGE